MRLRLSGDSALPDCKAPDVEESEPGAPAPRLCGFVLALPAGWGIDVRDAWEEYVGEDGV